MNRRRVLNTKIAICKTDYKKITVFGAMLLNGNDIANPSGRTVKRNSECWISRTSEKMLKEPHKHNGEKKNRIFKEVDGEIRHNAQRCLN